MVRSDTANSFEISLILNPFSMRFPRTLLGMSNCGAPLRDMSMFGLVQPYLLHSILNRIMTDLFEIPSISISCADNLLTMSGVIFWRLNISLALTSPNVSRIASIFPLLQKHLQNKTSSH